MLDDAAALLLHAPHRLGQLPAAVAALRRQDVAGQAFGVDAHQDRLGRPDGADAQRQMLPPGQPVLEGPHDELAERRRQQRLVQLRDEGLGRHPVREDVVDRDVRQPVRRRDLAELGAGRDLAARVEDLAEGGAGPQAGRAGQIDARLRPAAARDDAARFGRGREDVAR